MARQELASRTPHELLSLAASPLLALWRTLNHVYWLFARRQGISELMDLDDHMLKDLGITRDDVRRAVNRPIAYDSAADLNCKRRSLRLVVHNS